MFTYGDYSDLAKRKRKVTANEFKARCSRRTINSCNSTVELLLKHESLDIKTVEISFSIIFKLNTYPLCYQQYRAPLRRY